MCLLRTRKEKCGVTSNKMAYNIVKGNDSRTLVLLPINHSRDNLKNIIKKIKIFNTLKVVY